MNMQPIATPSHNWFAVYTKPRHEKRVAQHLAIQRIEFFLPLYRSLRRWNNGCKVEVELPLFPSYLFVRISKEERPRVLGAYGVLSFVGIKNTPAVLPDFEIESLRTGLQQRKCEPNPYLVVGEKARIKAGPMAGMEGVLVRKKNDLRVVLSVHLIRQSIAVEVEADDIEICETCSLSQRTA